VEARQPEEPPGTTTLVAAAGHAKGNDVKSVTCPSGAVATHARNDDGQLNEVKYRPSAGEAEVTLVANVTHDPYGGPSMLSTRRVRCRKMHLRDVRPVGKCTLTPVLSLAIVWAVPRLRGQRDKAGGESIS